MAGQTPLHRLIFFHHRTAREAAEVLGVDERTVRSWLNGTRTPSTTHLLNLARVYEVNPANLDTDVKREEMWRRASFYEVPKDFLRELADPERVRKVDEENIPAALRERKKEAMKAV
jgi:transcriptional regulator with XRE-family HTH domain